MTQKLMPRPIVGFSHTIDITAVSSSTTELLTKPILRLVSTADCFVRFTAGPSSATAEDMFLPSRELILVNRDSIDTISVISPFDSGELYITELA